VDLAFALPGSELPERIEALRALRPERGLYGGNGWANYAAAYFNDCRRFALGLRAPVRAGRARGPGQQHPQIAPTDHHLGEIAALRAELTSQPPNRRATASSSRGAPAGK
jgi:hypothetical protein